MKGRWIFLGIAIGVVVTLTFGFGFASGRPMIDRVGPTPKPQATGDWWAAMDAMHDSAWMEQMRAQMGPELAAQCDAMHERMGPGMMGANGGSGGMMGW